MYRNSEPENRNNIVFLGMDTLFFWLSKLLWLLISPLNFILLLLGFTCLLFFSRAQRLAKGLLGCIVVVLFLFAFFPFGSWLFQPLESRFTTNPDLPESIEGIVVLSGALNAEHSALWKQIEVNGAVDRELAFLKLARAYPDAQLIYTGGSSSLTQGEYKAADVAKKLFGELGIDTSRIIFERQARNTWENATFSYEIAEPRFEQPWILITSAYHMPRSIGIFCKIGWPMIPYPVDHQTLPGPGAHVSFNLAGHMALLNMAIHEWIGLLAYRLTGKTGALLPRQCKANEL